MPREGGGEAGARVGADVGATLAKLAVRRRGREPEFRLIPAEAVERVVREIGELRPERLGLTGGGASRIAQRLGIERGVANEFEAWATGARELLGRDGGSVPERFLLVSVGTGTSAVLVDPEGAVRVGGTALGGGTLAGLARILVGTSEFEVITRLAREGDRRRIDLLVGDIYPRDELPLPGDLNAASFAKLARGADATPSDPGDLAHAITGLVGENVALISGGLASAAGVGHIVYGGSTLRNNPAFSEILLTLAPLHSCRATILEDGEFAGALGALALAEGPRR